MGQLAVTIAGGIVGSFFGMPQLGLLAGGLLGSALFPQGQQVGGARLDDRHVTSSTYGRVIPIGWGTLRTGGNIIWSDDLHEHKHKQGKGMGGAASYTYSWTGAVAICDVRHTRPVSRILKIWADTKLVYDATGQSGITKNIPGNGGGGGGKGGGTHTAQHPVVNGGVTAAFNKVGTFRLYSGSDTQMPDPAYEALYGAENVSAHRGTAYVVFDDIDLTNYGSRVPNWSFEVQFDDGNQMDRKAYEFEFDTSVIGYPDGVALDAFRQRAYFITSGNSADSGLHSIDIKSNTEIATASMSTVFHGANYYGTSEGLIVATDGYLYMWTADANYGTFHKIDPNTLLEVGRIGTPDPYESFGGATTHPYSVVPLRLAYGNYLFVAGNTFSDIHLLNLDALNESAAGIVEYETARLFFCGGNQLSNDAAQVFGLGMGSSISGGSSGIYLYRFNVGPGSISKSTIRIFSPSDIDPAWVTWQACSGPLFDATDGNVIFTVQCHNSVPTGHSQYYTVKVSSNDGSILWKAPVTTVPPVSYQSMISSGTYSFVASDKIFSIQTQTGAVSSQDWSGVTASNNQIWSDALGAILIKGIVPDVFDNRWGVLAVNEARNGVALSTVVSDICGIAGLVSADISVSALTDTVEGFIVDSENTAKDALAMLALAFNFDAVESDDKIKFVKRGGVSLVTIPKDDMAVVDDTLNLIVDETRVQEMDLHSRISINFLDPNRSYQASTQYARRPVIPTPTMYSRNTRTEALPLVAEPGDIRQLAEKLLYAEWIGRVSYRAKLPWSYLIYDPTDNVTLTLADDSTAVVRLTAFSLGADLTLEVSAQSDSPASYSSTAVADSGLGFRLPDLTPSSATQLFLLDMPLLRDSDDPGQSYAMLYYGASGYSSNWPGCSIYRSYDDVSYAQEAPVLSQAEMPWGTTTTALPDTSTPFTLDVDNTLTVKMGFGADELSSVTFTQMCNGSNAAALLNPITGNIEIIQFQTVTQNPDGTLTLSRLLRGRRGTEVYTSGHTVGEYFCVLTPSDLQSMKVGLAQVNAPTYFKPVTGNAMLSSVDAIRFYSTGRALKPYAPVQVAATLSGSDIDLTWVRRTRLGGEMQNFTGYVPLSEQFESYEVDVYNAAGDTVLRTLRVDFGPTPSASPGVTYEAADIAEDFGSTPSSLTVAVYQISATVGRGFTKKVTVEVA